MTSRIHSGKEPNFKKIVILSAVFHAMLLYFAATQLQTTDHDYKSYSVKLVSPSSLQQTSVPKTAPKTEQKPAPRKKDVVKKSLPDKKLPEKGVSLEPEKSPPIKASKKISPRRKTAPSPKTDPAPTPDKSLERELERLSAISKMEKKRAEKQQEQQREEEAQNTVASAIADLRRRKLISVSGTPSPSSSSKSSDIDAYSAIIREEILFEWIHPPFESAQLEAIISFKIDKRGLTSSLEIISSSGNTLFDKSAINAIIKASPLTAPPIEQEIEIKFHL
ncbi:MAG: TonB family protein [Nitrospira sp.]|nr:TonB family protein [bacterium]MBL7048294.1 TonB family protein [Nitrospira sp.]